MGTVDPLSMHFDQYQRYTVATQVADRLRTHQKQEQLHVLDVGGFSRTQRGDPILPLVHLLPEDYVLVVDLVEESLSNYSLASGLHLPFGSGAFDLVVSCDTLEHIPAIDRITLMDELLRVARHCLVLIAPFDNEYTRRAERTLHEFIRSQGVQNPQLEEHLQHGLPTIESVRTHLVERGLAAVDFADGYLPHWLTMMLFKHIKGWPADLYANLDRYYNRYFSPGDRRKPAYRHVFVIAKPGDETLLPAVVSACCRSGAPEAYWNLDFSGDLIRLLEQYQGFMVTRSQLIALETENARLRQLVAGYERGRFMRTMRWLHEQRTRLWTRFPGC